MVFAREVRCQQTHCREVHRPIAEQLEDDRVPPRGPARFDAAIGGVLGEMEHLHAVGEHGGTAFSEVQSSLVQDGEMGDKDCRRLPLTLGEEFHLREEFVIGEPTSQRQHVGVHGLGITRRLCNP